MNEARRNYRGQINFIDANLDEPKGKELASRYGIANYPILLFLDGDGNQVSLLQGVFPLSIVKKACDELIAGK